MSDDLVFTVLEGFKADLTGAIIEFDSQKGFNLYRMSKVAGCTEAHLRAWHQAGFIEVAGWPDTPAINRENQTAVPQDTDVNARAV